MKKAIAIVMALTAIAAQTHDIPASFTRHFAAGHAITRPIAGWEWPPIHRGDDWHYAGIRLRDAAPVTGP